MQYSLLPRGSVASGEPGYRFTAAVTLVLVGATCACGHESNPPNRGVSTGGADPNGGGPSTGGTATIGDSGNSTAPVPCGTRGARYRGKSSQTVTAAGVARTFVLYEGANLDAQKPVPLVIVPHRLFGSGDNMMYVTGFDKIADREGFVAAFPDSQDGTWNVGRDVCEPDDVTLPAMDSDIDQAFLNKIIEFVDTDQCIDRKHVFVTGFSMGGYFTYETACLNPAFHGAGPHSGGTHDLSNCLTRHVPMIIFHAGNDKAIPYACGTAARDQWVQHNGCSLTDPEVVAVKGGSCEYYRGCPADGQVALCTFIAPEVATSDAGATGRTWGHGWSGGAPDDFSFPETDNASELAWAFFKSFAW